MAEQFCACGKPGDSKRVHTKDRCYISMDIQRDMQKRGETVPSDIERKNAGQLCGSCGAEMTGLRPGEVVNDCGACGARFFGAQTPPIEDLANLCGTCRHAIAPEHDDFGCHVLDCGCTHTGKGAIDQIQAVLPNATDPIVCPECESINTHASTCSKYPYPEKKNAGAKMACPYCKGPNGTRFIDSQGGTRQMGAKPLDGYQCDDCDSLWAVDPKTNEVLKNSEEQKRSTEKTNAWTPEFLKRNPDYKSKIEPRLARKWDGASVEQRAKWLKQTGSHADDAGLSFAELTSGNHGASQAEVMMELMAELTGERINKRERKNGLAICQACLQRVKNPDGKETVMEGQTAHIVVRQSAGHVEVACGADVCPCENANSHPERANIIHPPKPGDDPGKGGRVYRFKDKQGEIVEVWMKLADQFGTAQADIRAMGIKMLSNAAPNFQQAIAAFEAHCKSCGVCGKVRNAPAGSDQADAKHLCPTGSQLLVADLQNSDDRYKCPKCGSGSMKGGQEAGSGERTCLDCGNEWKVAVENADIHPSKRKCPKCDFVGYPTDVVSHLQRQHGVSEDDAHDLVPAPENANSEDLHPVMKCAQCGESGKLGVDGRWYSGPGMQTQTGAVYICKPCAQVNGLQNAADQRRDTYKCRSCGFTTQDLAAASKHEDEQKTSECRMDTTKGSLSAEQERQKENGGSDICATCKKERGQHRDDGKPAPAGVCDDFKGSDSSPFVAMNSSPVTAAAREAAGAKLYGSRS